MESNHEEEKKKRWIQNISLALASAVATFLALEVFLWRFFPQKTFKTAEVFSPFCFRQSEYLPMQLRANATCRQIQEEFNITVHTNSLGYRSPEFTLEKPNGKKRILVFGDSFAFGYGVEDVQTFPHILEVTLNQNQKENNWEVVNAAYASGDSPDSYYAYLKREGLTLSPDIIIEALFVGNDFTDLFETKWLATDELGLPTKITTVDRFIDEKGRLLHPSMPVNYRIPILRNSHLFQFLYDRLKPKIDTAMFKVRALIKKPYVKKYAHPEPHVYCIHNRECMRKDPGLFENVEKVNQLIKATNDLARQAHARFILLVIPSDLQLYKGAWERWGKIPFTNESPDQPQQILVSYLSSQGIETIDLLPLVRKDKQRLYFPKDAHFNSEGHQKTAEILYQYLKEKDEGFR